MELNWPAVVLVLGLASLVLFRGAFTRLIERTEKVKDWLHAPKQPSVPASTDQTLPTRDLIQEQRSLEVLTQDFNNQLLLIQEESIRTDLATHGFTADGACEKVLVKHLAATQIVLTFEKVYAVLYGSQLQALRWLNSQPAGVHADALKPFYEQAVNAWPAMYQNVDFRSWLSFLAGQGLITESEASSLTGDEEEAFGVTITVMGREFLAYLVNGGRADPWAG